MDKIWFIFSTFSMLTILCIRPKLVPSISKTATAPSDGHLTKKAEKKYQVEYNSNYSWEPKNCDFHSRIYILLSTAHYI